MATSSFTHNLVITDRKVCEKLLKEITLGPKEPSSIRSKRYRYVSQKAIKNARKWKI